MATGGHQLIFELSPLGPQVRIGDLEIDAEPCSQEDLILSLPFDLYQRYRLAAQVGSRLTQGPILDVGGLLGDRDGHLATTAGLLLRAGSRRAGEDPNHRPAALRPSRPRSGPAWEQPFDDTSFDLVLALDVLEHLEPERRSDLLAELDRVARSFILIGAPFSTPAVERTEEELARGLLDTRRFLEEHRTLGLPSHSLVESHFEDRPGMRFNGSPAATCLAGGPCRC